MDQTTARRLAHAVNAANPQAKAVATTVDAQAGRWEKTHEWIVTRVNGPTYYEVPPAFATDAGPGAPARAEK